MGDSRTTTWPDDRIEVLRTLWAEGLTCSQIADALNARFGCDLTRNAVIGKVHRSGMPKRGKKVWRETVVTTNRARADERRKSEARDAETIIRRNSLPRKPIPEPVMHDASHAKPWLERGFGQCAYPISGEGADTVSCCAPSAGATYCAFHANAMFVKPETTGNKFIKSLRWYAA